MHQQRHKSKIPLGWSWTSTLLGSQRGLNVSFFIVTLLWLLSINMNYSCEFTSDWIIWKYDIASRGFKLQWYPSTLILLCDQDELKTVFPDCFRLNISGNWNRKGRCTSPCGQLFWVLVVSLQYDSGSMGQLANDVIRRFQMRRKQRPPDWPEWHTDFLAYGELLVVYNVWKPIDTAMTK